MPRPPGYQATHTYLQKHFPLPDECENCGKPGAERALRPGHEYTRDPADYIGLCRGCHNRMDRSSPEHGTRRSYDPRNGPGCKCDVCRAANAKRHREQRARRKQRKEE